MSVEVAGFDSPNLSLYSEAAGKLASRLHSEVSSVNQAIIADAQGYIVDLYGAKLAKFWEVAEQSPPNDEVAHVIIKSDDYRVIGYEYGTRAHDISASNRALRFEWHGGISYFPYVHHPGNRPHLKGPQLRALITASAKRHWTERLNDLLTNAFSQ